MKALENVKPALEVKARRVGGANYQVPMEVSADRSQSLALRWLDNAARTRGGKSMAERLANEIVDASNNTGGAVKNVKIHIEWQKLIKHLHTIVGRKE